MASFLLNQDNADPVLLGDHDVALASIDKVVAGEPISTYGYFHETYRTCQSHILTMFCVVVGPSRTKLVTPTCSLKFTPEELVLYCRDMRVLCFLFDRLTPDTQAVEVCLNIRKYKGKSLGSVRFSLSLSKFGC